MLKSSLWKTLAGSLVLTGMVTLATGGTAHALTNILHGSECHPFSPPDTAAGAELQHSWQGIYNASVSAAKHFVMCPILRDNTGTTGGLTSLTVNTISLTPAATSIDCAAVVVSKFGSVVRSLHKTGVPTSTGMSLAYGSAMNTSNANSGGYVVQCELGAGAVITSIEYGEP